MVHYSDQFPAIKFSIFLSEQLNKDYHSLSELFSKTKGITIEQYIILHKIEKVKELIMYDELNLSEIAYKLNYSSVAHLSNQFKKITGLTPSFFKAILKKKQEQVLSSNKSLDLGEDTQRMSEPSFIILTILLGLALWYRQRRQRKWTN
jgi:AraC-like DNA-binding protein